jgi:hypothetical protein
MCVAAAIAGAAVVGAGAAVYSANKQAGAAQDAANAATQGTNATVSENQREFNLARADTQPSRQIGANAIASLSKLYGYAPSQVGPDGTVTGTPSGTPDMSGFFTSPDYTFNLQQGQRAIDNSLVARGRGLSGAEIKASTGYAQGLASSQYSDYVNRLMAQAGLGQTGVNTSTQAGLATAGSDAAARANQTNALTAAANARASAYGNMAAGVNNSVQGGVGNYLLLKYLAGGG